MVDVELILGKTAFNNFNFYSFLSNSHESLKLPRFISPVILFLGAIVSAAVSPD
jgi:hypothetical protein